MVNKMIFRCWWKMTKKTDVQQENQLKWDNIMTFAVVALFLFILVQTSPNVKTLATTLIQQVQTSITNLFGSIGSLG